MRKNIFVFVVCGADNHIRTLNYSLGHLRHFSKNEILVVTDSSRNTLEIGHANVLDISTPTELSHHQASIYLKVGLHKFVDMTHQYCYLDSDVVAVNEDVDTIFYHPVEPIAFAADHCTMRQFSPTAIKCPCIENRQKDIDLLKQLEASYLKLERKFHEDLRSFNDQYIPSDPKGFENYKKLKDIIQEYSEGYRWFLKTPPAFQFILARFKPGTYNFEKFLQSKGDYFWNDKNKQAFDSAGNLLYDARAEPPQHPSYYHHIKSNSPFIWSEINTYWLNQKGEDIYSVANCTHLEEQLAEKFEVTVNSTWQHWNGGVFLFNSASTEFMDKWFDKTMKIFEDAYWKTRDQGTLIATVWEMGLQEAGTLPQEFNFLADRKNLHLKFKEKKGFSFDDFLTCITPSFIHVYHDFGITGWDVWDYIDSTIQADKIKETVSLR